MHIKLSLKCQPRTIYGVNGWHYILAPLVRFIVLPLLFKKLIIQPFTVVVNCFCLVQPAGIEPASMALQTTAMTTSAKVALSNRIAFLAFFQEKVWNVCCCYPKLGAGWENRTLNYWVEASDLTIKRTTHIWNLGSDSNRRTTILQTAPLGLLGTQT